jgi:hypothetical protein
VSWRCLRAWTYLSSVTIGTFRAVPILWLITLACVFVVLTGCSGHNKSSSAESSAQPVASSTQTTVLRSYEAYWDAVLKASDPPNPNARVLSAHASGLELDRAVEAIRARKKAGERLRGNYTHAAKVTTMSGNTAMVADCLTPNVVVVKGKKQGARGVAPSSVKPMPIVVLLVNEQQTWKVERIDAGSAPCPA